MLRSALRCLFRTRGTPEVNLRWKHDGASYGRTESGISLLTNCEISSQGESVAWRDSNGDQSKPSHTDALCAATAVTSVREAHRPVMVKEVTDIISPSPGQVVVDLTFGGGGHTKALLDRCQGLTIYALDRDPVAHRLAQRLAETRSQVRPLLGLFSALPALLREAGVERVDAALIDAGASSMQYDSAQRGFSLSHCAPLDMRMDPTDRSGSVSACDVINHMSQESLAEVLRVYGEERHARVVARAIAQHRTSSGPLHTTIQLAEVVAGALGGLGARLDRLGRPAHPATRTFQALRIFVNNELNELHNALHSLHALLRPGGVCVSISFHSLEDRIVKRHFHHIDMDAPPSMSIAARARGACARPEVQRPLEGASVGGRWEPMLGRRALTPGCQEISENPRARSAKLRAARRL